MKTRIIVVNFIAIVAAGCAAGSGSVLVFGQHTTIGISLGGSPSAQGVDFTLGYKDQNIAIVPVSSGGENGGEPIRSKAPDEYGDHEDSLSVLGQFELSTNSKTADVGLGKFFATGLAAKALADGFSYSMSPGDERTQDGEGQGEEGGDADSDDEVDGDGDTDDREAGGDDESDTDDA